jgi:DNA polymerase-3 subunit beta
MRATFDRETLLAALTPAASAVAKRSHLPVLAGVLATPNNGRVTFTGTNLETAVSVTCDAETHGNGVAVVIPAAELLAFVKSAPKRAAVAIDSAEGDNPAVTVSAGLASRTLRGIDADEFPTGVTAPTGTGETFTLRGQDLRAAIDATAFAVGDDTRPILSGIAFRPVPAGLEMCAADNYRLSFQTIAAAGPETDTAETVIPAACTAILARTIGKHPGAVEMTGYRVPGRVSWNAVRVTFGDAVVTVRTIDGQFPNWRQIVPPVSAETFTARIDADTLTAALATFGRDVTTVRVSFGDAVRITSHGADNPAETVIPADRVAFDGEEMRIGFNRRYLADFRKLASGDAYVTVRGNSPLSPIVMTAGPATYVVMPMRIADTAAETAAGPAETADNTRRVGAAA